LEYKYQNTDAPKFKTNLKNSFTVDLGSVTNYAFPKIIDPDDDPFTLEIVSMDAKDGEILPYFLLFNP